MNGTWPGRQLALCRFVELETTESAARTAEALVALVAWLELVVALPIAIAVWIGQYIVRKGVEAGIMRAAANLLERGVVPIPDDRDSTTR